MAQAKIYYTFEVSAKQLKKMDIFGKSDPYFVINTPEVSNRDVGNAGGVTVSTTVSLMLPIVSSSSTYETTKAAHAVPLGYRQAYVSPMFKRTLNCTWPPFTISDADLCDGNIDQELQFICYDWDKGRPSEVIGEVRTSVRRIHNLEGSALTLVKADKSRRGLLYIKFTASDLPTRKGDTPHPTASESPHRTGTQLFTPPPKRTRSSLSISYTPEKAHPLSHSATTPENSVHPQALAMYAYTGQYPEQLTFREGDLISIISTEGDWWEAELKGKKGYVPSNLVALL